MHLAHTRSSRPGFALCLAALCALIIIAWVAAGAVPAAVAAPVQPFEQGDARWAFTGNWTTYAASGFSGGSHAFTNTAGAEVTMAFVGTGMDLIATTGPKFGVAAVIVDGGAPNYVDLYSESTAFQQSVCSVAGLEESLHIVRIVCTGAARPAAADTFISVDALSLTGTPRALPVEQSDRRIAKRGIWTTAEAVGSSGGSFMLTREVGDEVVIAFTGTGIDLVGTVGPNYGIASVSIDGGAPVDVDLYATRTEYRRIVYSTGVLPPGPHVVRMVCTGRKAAVAADSYVGLDAALAEGTVTQGVVRYEETDRRMAWGGNLADEWCAALSGGRYIWLNPDWGAVAVSFVGSRLDWVSVTGPQYGVASVSIDGGSPQYVDLYTPDMRLQQVVYSTGEIPFGQHTAVVSWTGRANAAASGTYVGIDAFDIGGDLLQAAAPTPPLTAASFGYPWNRYIVIDKSELRLYFVENGLIVKVYPVATGRPSMPTPSRIWRIDAKYYTDPTSVYGPRKMRLFRQAGNGYEYTAYAIHGTDTDSSIGTYASHGCIRMHNYDVLEFFDMVPLGTMVVTRD